jgi:MFS family permease
MDDSKHHDALVSKEVNVAASETSGASSIDSEAQQAKIYAAQRKVDKRLFLWYCLVYLIMRINVSNITNTAIMNEETGNDIKTTLGGLSSSQWAWALSIFYYPYAAWEPASTLLIKRFSPRVWMSRIMVTWGAVSMCQAATQNYSGILACRFFLGLAEAGYYPGVLYHLSFWLVKDA